MSGESRTESSCLLCGGPCRPRHRFGERWIAYCGRCRLGHLTPLPGPDELASLYGSRDYFEGGAAVGYADYAGDAAAHRRTFARKLARLQRSGPVGDLLEVGCGPGRFLEVAREAGIPRAVGVDLNPWVVEEARRAGHVAHCGGIEAVSQDERFDAVVMLDLIEHVADPAAFLKQVRTRLRPGGRIFVMTPNIRSLLARVSGRRWVSYKIPEHLYYYSPASIRRLLGGAGFEVLEVRGTGQYVTLDFLWSRLGRLVPVLPALARRACRALGASRRLVFVTNGSIDVVARRT